MAITFDTGAPVPVQSIPQPTEEWRRNHQGKADDDEQDFFGC